MAISTASLRHQRRQPICAGSVGAKEKINVTLLSDYEHKVAKQLRRAPTNHFFRSSNLGFAGVAKRSAFLVDRGGVIQYAEVHDDARELPISTRSKRSSRS